MFENFRDFFKERDDSHVLTNCASLAIQVGRLDVRAQGVRRFETDHPQVEPRELFLMFSLTQSAKSFLRLLFFKISCVHCFLVSRFSFMDCYCASCVNKLYLSGF